MLEVESVLVSDVVMLCDDLFFLLAWRARGCSVFIDKILPHFSPEPCVQLYFSTCLSMSADGFTLEN